MQTTEAASQSPVNVTRPIPTVLNQSSNVAAKSMQTTEAASQSPVNVTRPIPTARELSQSVNQSPENVTRPMHYQSKADKGSSIKRVAVVFASPSDVVTDLAFKKQVPALAHHPQQSYHNYPYIRRLNPD